MTTGRPFNYEVELPSQPDSLTAIHPVIEQWTSSAGLDTQQGHRVAVAVSEAITNAIIHAHSDPPGRTVSVRFWTDADRLCAEIGDHGSKTWTVPTPPDLSRWEQTNGRGLALIRLMAEEFAIEPRPGGGTLVRMTFLKGQAGTTDSSKHDRAVTRETVTCITDKGEQSMNYRVEKHDDVDVLKISGRLDLISSNNLKDSVRQRLDENRTLLVLNMRGVDFINSSGLGALVSILKDVRLVNGRLVLSDLAPYVQEIFEITQLTNVFEIHPTEADAVHSVTPHRQPEMVDN